MSTGKWWPFCSSHNVLIRNWCQNSELWQWIGVIASDFATRECLNFFIWLSPEDLFLVYQNVPSWSICLGQLLHNEIFNVFWRKKNGMIEKYCIFNNLWCMYIMVKCFSREWQNVIQEKVKFYLNKRQVTWNLLRNGHQVILHYEVDKRIE